jgi:hypothetical protein
VSDDLVAFLRARLDEDEAAATAATAGPWEWDDSTDIGEWGHRGPKLMSATATWTTSEGRGPYPVTVLAGYGYDAWGLDVGDGDKAFIARYDPARVLREVEAKRAIVKSESSPYLAGHAPATVTLRYLAAVYRDHPDYQPEWKP